MELFPFQKISDIPNGKNGFANISCHDDLIDVMDAFKLDIIRATKKPYYRGVSAYLFNAQIQFGFDKSYKIIDVEFRKPFVFEGIQGLFFEKANLFQNTLQDTYDLLAQKGFELKKTDVGFAAEKLSISFFSDSFERSLDVPLDAVTVHF